ncbi:hypothetical protein Goari_019090 [Gossypium aridum]|uniref:TF-B3 domain-containing protein n=1 Tax=Gossypium aridum TaxID=34290 RepID=A0A7J8WRQ4_GOSAI|nr:hypothetical protein [Gossypium aridum]
MFTLYSDSGNSWRVKVKVQQGSYLLKQWMVKVCQISWPGKRDFLVFFLVDSSMLDVFIYNRTACAKNIILAAKKPKGRPPRVSRQIEQTPNKKPRTVPL